MPVRVRLRADPTTSDYVLRADDFVNSK